MPKINVTTPAGYQIPVVLSVGSNYSHRDTLAPNLRRNLGIILYILTLVLNNLFDLLPNRHNYNTQNKLYNLHSLFIFHHLSYIIFLYVLFSSAHYYRISLPFFFSSSLISSPLLFSSHFYPSLHHLSTLLSTHSITVTTPSSIIEDSLYGEEFFSRS
jgi:hypothetical protein